MPTKKPRYTVIVDEELMKRIDDFRFENRYSSRSAATLELIRLGMDALKRDLKEKEKEKENKDEYAPDLEAAHIDGEWTKAHEQDLEATRELARQKKDRERKKRLAK